MKVNELVPGIYQYMDQVSLDVQIAQRQAELEQLAKYRAKRMAHYYDWVKPENIVEREAAHKAAAAEALERGKIMAAQAQAQMFAREMTRAKHEFKMTPIVKRRKSWWQRLLDWVFGDA